MKCSGNTVSVTAGKLEIGGFKFKKTLQNPPELMLEGEIQKLTSWAQKLAQALPRVKVRNIAVAFK